MEIVTSSVRVHRCAVCRVLLLAAVLVGSASCSSDPGGGGRVSVEATAVAPDVDPVLVRSDAGLQAIADAAGSFAMIGVADGRGRTAVVSGVDFEGDPVSAEDAFALWSGTKMFTATAALQAVDDGILDLDQPIAEYVDFPFPGDVTMRHLLSHRSGIGDGPGLVCDPDENLEILQRIADAAPLFEPGTRGEYSNIGFALAGLVLGSVRGQPLSETMQRDIFDPLNMSSTYFMETGDGQLPFGEYDESVVCGEGLPTIAADGGLVTTADDLEVFLRALHEGGLLSAESLAEMLQRESVVNGFDYGLGMGMISAPDGSGPVRYGHNGTYTYDAGGVYEPGDGRTIVVVTRGGDWWEIVQRVSDWAVLGE